MVAKVPVLDRWFLGLIFLTYVALISLHGYRYGDIDASETAAYALSLDAPELYAGDLYMQHVRASVLNERYPFAFLLHLFDPDSPWTFLFLHAIFSLVLLYAICCLAQQVLRYRSTVVLFIALNFFFLYYLTLGENEVWYNYLMPSLPAKSLGALSFLCYVRHKRLPSYLLLILATLFQPIVGAQLALLFLVIDAWKFRWKSGQLKEVLIPPLLYGSTAGLWILLVYVRQTQGDQVVSNEAFFEIMELRLAHHFFPSYYPLRNWLVMIILAAASMLVWRKQNVILYRFTVCCVVGYFIYTCLIEYFSCADALVLQWFKTTVWLKPIGILALLRLVERKLPVLGRKWVVQIAQVGTLLILPFTLVFPQVVTNKPFHFPWSNYDHPAIRIVRTAQIYTPVDASIITPPEMSELRYFGQRGVFIDYKSNLHSKGYLAESQRRRSRLYGLTLDLKRSGSDVAESMSRHYQQQTAQNFLDWKSDGATHVITAASHQLDLVLVYQDDSYAIYLLQPL